MSVNFCAEDSVKRVQEKFLTDKRAEHGLPIPNKDYSPSLTSFVGGYFCFSLPENERALLTLTPPNNFPLSPKREQLR